MDDKFLRAKVMLLTRMLMQPMDPPLLEHGYLTMGIDEGIPSQLAPSVGMSAAGSTISVASSEGNNSPMTSANGNSLTKLQNQNSPNQAVSEGSSNRSLHPQKAHQSLQQISRHTRQRSRKLLPGLNQVWT